MKEILPFPKSMLNQKNQVGSIDPSGPSASSSQNMRKRDYVHICNICVYGKGRQARSQTRFVGDFGFYTKNIEKFEMIVFVKLYIRLMY